MSTCTLTVLADMPEVMRRRLAATRSRSFACVNYCIVDIISSSFTEGRLIRLITMEELLGDAIALITAT